MKYELVKLPYSYNALEPYISAQTMEIHHGKHHQAYVNNLNTVLEKYPALADKPLTELLVDLSNLDMVETDKNFFKNNAGGVLNHNFFWEIMDPKKEKDEKLVMEIAKEFGSLEEFKKLFTQTAVAHFGSGWAWLARDQDDKLLVYSLLNQDSPCAKGHQPILTLDVWEHAYYLQYQNRRAEYIENWWKVIKLV